MLVRALPLFLLSLGVVYGFKFRSARSITSSTTRLAAGKGRYCLNVTLYPNPARREEFVDCIRNNQNNSVQEPKCVQYTWGESTTESNVFHFHEEYEDKDGFEFHTKTPHFALWDKFASSDNAFTKPPEVLFFEEL